MKVASTASLLQYTCQHSTDWLGEFVDTILTQCVVRVTFILAIEYLDLGVVMLLWCRMYLTYKLEHRSDLEAVSVTQTQSVGSMTCDAGRWRLRQAVLPRVASLNLSHFHVECAFLSVHGQRK